MYPAVRADSNFPDERAQPCERFRTFDLETLAGKEASITFPWPF